VNGAGALRRRSFFWTSTTLSSAFSMSATIRFASSPVATSGLLSPSMR
jgi:hypothetical protein